MFQYALEHLATLGPCPSFAATWSHLSGCCALPTIKYCLPVTPDPHAPVQISRSRSRLNYFVSLVDRLKDEIRCFYLLFLLKKCSFFVPLCRFVFKGNKFKSSQRSHSAPHCSLGLCNKCKCNNHVIWLVAHDLSKVV